MRAVPRLLVHCAHCGAEMWKTEARLRGGRGRYCSKECGGAAAVKRGQIGPYQGRHGMSHTRIHNIWMGIRDRCLCPTNKSFNHYGGRGIKICERWESFENFLADMGESPSPKHSIDRIDHNGGYSPENCRWATQAEQLRNTRRTRFEVYAGKKWCVTDLAAHLGLDLGTLRGRIRCGWPKERWAQPPRYQIKARGSRPSPGHGLPHDRRS